MNNNLKFAVRKIQTDKGINITITKAEKFQVLTIKKS